MNRSHTLRKHCARSKFPFWAQYTKSVRSVSRAAAAPRQKHRSVGDIAIVVNDCYSLSRTRHSAALSGGSHGTHWSFCLSDWHKPLTSSSISQQNECDERLSIIRGQLERRRMQITEELSKCIFHSTEKCPLLICPKKNYSVNVRQNVLVIL